MSEVVNTGRVGVQHAACFYVKVVHFATTVLKHLHHELFQIGWVAINNQQSSYKRGEHFNISLLGKLCCIDNLIIKLHCNNIITF